jgi:hypothetical protein
MLILSYILNLLIFHDADIINKSMRISSPFPISRSAYRF